MSNFVRLLLPLALLLLLSLPPPDPPSQAESPPEWVPAVQVIPSPEESEGLAEPEEAMENPPDWHVIEGCMVTYYDVCILCCGKDDGITASGAEAVPYETCAVDPAVIPLGSSVVVKYEDGTILRLRAEDTGSGVRGNHVDVCVSGHEEALALGVQQATVYWE